MRQRQTVFLLGLISITTLLLLFGGGNGASASSGDGDLRTVTAVVIPSTDPHEEPYVLFVTIDTAEVGDIALGIHVASASRGLEFSKEDVCMDSAITEPDEQMHFDLCMPVGGFAPGEQFTVTAVFFDPSGNPIDVEVACASRP